MSCPGVAEDEGAADAASAGGIAPVAVWALARTGMDSIAAVHTGGKIRWVMVLYLERAESMNSALSDGGIPSETLNRGTTRCSVYLMDPEKRRFFHHRMRKHEAD